MVERSGSKIRSAIGAVGQLDNIFRDHREASIQATRTGKVKNFYSLAQETERIDGGEDALVVAAMLDTRCVHETLPSVQRHQRHPCKQFARKEPNLIVCPHGSSRGLPVLCIALAIGR